jgi:hypothetical protein
LIISDELIIASVINSEITYAVMPNNPVAEQRTLQTNRTPETSEAQKPVPLADYLYESNKTPVRYSRK